MARSAARGVIAAMAMTGMRRVTTGLGLLEQAPPDAMAEQEPTMSRLLARTPPVYREQGGRRLRANRQLVAAKGSAGRGAVYSVLDRRAPRSARRYRLEEVKRDGARFVLGDVAVAG